MFGGKSWLKTEETNWEYPQGVVTPREEEEILRSPEEDILTIHFEDGNKELILDYDPNMSISEVKKDIEPYVGIAAEQQEFRIRHKNHFEYLIHGRLIDNNILGGDVITLTIQHL